MSERQYRLPDLLCDWPWTRYLSPHYPKAKKESSDWVNSFHPFSARGQKGFDACDLNLLASLTYSRRNREFVRAGCDLMNFYFIYDEYTDVSDPVAAANLANIVIDAMKNPEAFPSNGSHLLGEMTRQFWRRANTLAKPGSPCFEHFIATSETYLHAVTQEAEDRASERIRSVDDYLDLRRDTCGARPTLAFIEFGLELPAEVTSHPVIVSLTEAAVDLIILVNDMHSYTREISCGLANHNIITAIMHEYNLDLQSAFDWLDAYANQVVARFLSDLDRVPCWDDDIDERVWMYVDGLGQWVRGNDDWSCEGKRYYGDDGLRIMETRLVSVKPRESNYLTLEAETAESEATNGEEVEVVWQSKAEVLGLRSDLAIVGVPRAELRVWWSWIATVVLRSILTRFPPWKF